RSSAARKTGSCDFGLRILDFGLKEIPGAFCTLTSLRMDSPLQNPQSSIQNDLLALAADLAACEQMAILGEGNVSARLDGETFLVKASGTRLGALRPEHLVAVRYAPLLAAMDGGASYDDAEMEALLLS